MLLDDYTTKLLSLCCKMTDLLAEGVTGKQNSYWYTNSNILIRKRERLKLLKLIVPLEEMVFG